ncbi:MAG: hypothetical protein KAI99_11535, partial [Cyclobacteriaceae bacterium]|nr:hypothetical protein [Cyclobacteriaceae bacterium]
MNLLILGEVYWINHFIKRAALAFYLITGSLFTGYAQSIFINEVQSSNLSTIYDHTGDTPDWIEIYNAGSSSVNLENYGLSD